MTEVPTNGALDTLGTFPIPDLGRDAIHLAVVPAIAGERLAPGYHVSYDPHTQQAKRCLSSSSEAVGIVDPFITTHMEPGVIFWLIVYPRTITSLRHVWTHPGFPPEGVTIQGPTKEESLAWLHDYCSSYLGLDDHTSDSGYFDTITSFIEKAIDSDDDYLVVSGVSAGGDIPFEFWHHVENYAGKPVRKKASYFSCSC